MWVAAAATILAARSKAAQKCCLQPPSHRACRFPQQTCWPDLLHAPQVVAYDFGIKHNILRRLTSAGCRVTVVPAAHAAEDVLAMKPDGIFLSNGPVRYTTNGGPVCLSMHREGGVALTNGWVVRPALCACWKTLAYSAAAVAHRGL